MINYLLGLNIKPLAERIDGQHEMLTTKIDGQSQVIAAEFKTIELKIDAVDRRLTGKLDDVGGDVEKLDNRLWEMQRQQSLNVSLGEAEDVGAALAVKHTMPPDPPD